MNKILIITAMTGAMLLPGTMRAQDAGAIVLEGTVYNSTTRQPVDFGSVTIIEARVRARTAGKGMYRAVVPAAGTYTVIVTSDGLQNLKLTMKIDRKMTRDFWLKPVRVSGGTLTVFGDRNIQKVSRYTMTRDEIKDVPASFGDSVTALTALPGVIKSFGGIFGPLVIRGASSRANRYYLDDIPLFSPQHFGGIHSVINSNLIREIDLFASSSPAQYGNADSAVIQINTIDAVEEFSGYSDIGLISANAFFAAPWHEKGIEIPGMEIEKPQDGTGKGYAIVSGRVSYLSLFVPAVYWLITGEKLDSVPEYWDYQAKFKYYPAANHSVTLLYFGSRDYIKFLQDHKPPDTIDPALQNLEFESDTMFHSQGLYYTYEPSGKFSNRALLFASLAKTHNYLNVEGAAIWLQGYYLDSKPYIFGFKDKVHLEWWKDHADLRMGVDVQYYYFVQDGKDFEINEYTPPGPPDFNNDNEFNLVDLRKKVHNLSIGSYIENKLVLGGFTLVHGVRSDYLLRSDKVTVDGRGMLSYDFPTDTTLSVAGGTYSAFQQINPYLFDSAPTYASEKGRLKPERAVNASGGIEQKIDLFTVKFEGFYNYYYDRVYPFLGDGNVMYVDGKLRTYGGEAMVRLDRREGSSAFFGWINYTLTQSKIKTGLPVTSDPMGDTFISSDWEQEHAVKVVAGYTRGRHTFSAKFQLYSSFPYTEIIGDDGDPGGVGRYVPIYSTDINAKHYPLSHQLDLRYTYRTDYEWGHVSWYIEIINAYNFVQKENVWHYDEPYSEGSNPNLQKPSGGLSFIPNFGVEVKF